MPFAFEAHSLHLPLASEVTIGNEDAILEEEDEHMAHQADELGN